MGLEIAGEVMAKLIVRSTAMTKDFPMGLETVGEEFPMGLEIAGRLWAMAQRFAALGDGASLVQL